MRNIIANVETTARDCDGMHYRDTEYHMEESERTGEFGDLEFFERIMGYVVSTYAESATLRIRQANGMPVFEYGEDTDEGFTSSTVTFTKAE